MHLEQVITSHAGLSWDTGRDDDDISALQSFPKLLRASIALQQEATLSEINVKFIEVATAADQKRTFVFALELMWLMSAATPGVPWISYRARSLT